MKTVIVNLMVMDEQQQYHPSTIVFRNVLSTKECTHYLRIRVCKDQERSNGVIETCIPHGRIIEFATYPEDLEPVAAKE